MQENPSFHFIFHFLFHLIIHYSGFHFLFHCPNMTLRKCEELACGCAYLAGECYGLLDKQVSSDTHGPMCHANVSGMPAKEYYGIFSVAYKLVIGFAAVGIINAVFMQETFKVAASDDKLMMRQKARSAVFRRTCSAWPLTSCSGPVTGARSNVAHQEDADIVCRCRRIW